MFKKSFSDKRPKFIPPNPPESLRNLLGYLEEGEWESLKNFDSLGIPEIFRSILQKIQ